MQKKRYSHLKNKAISLRREGKTYGQIQDSLKIKIPKSTLSTWFYKLNLTRREINKIAQQKKFRIINGRIKARATMQELKRLRTQSIRNSVLHLRELSHKKEVEKIILAIMYWCEGSKHGSCTFGNSDPSMIAFFLELLRRCYDVDESKFRCTVQCRADQDAKTLNAFWSSITRIPFNQFYAARIDKRSVGKPTKKLDYKGVLKIDYFSTSVYNELRIIAALLSNQGEGP